MLIYLEAQTSNLYLRSRTRFPTERLDMIFICIQGDQKSFLHLFEYMNPGSGIRNSNKFCYQGFSPGYQPNIYMSKSYIQHWKWLNFRRDGQMKMLWKTLLILLTVLCLFASAQIVNGAEKTQNVGGNFGRAWLDNNLAPKGNGSRRTI